MPPQVSFDVTSNVDLQEVDNAVNQAKKELAQRYDFKGSKSSIDFKRGENLIDLTADDNFKMDAVWEILQTRMVRRGVPVKNLKTSENEPIAGGLVKKTITLQQGIPTDAARQIGVVAAECHGPGAALLERSVVQECVGVGVQDLVRER